jgi:hypothetical protein
MPLQKTDHGYLRRARIPAPGSLAPGFGAYVDVWISGREKRLAKEKQCKKYNKTGFFHVRNASGSVFSIPEIQALSEECARRLPNRSILLFTYNHIPLSSQFSDTRQRHFAKKHPAAAAG